MLKFLSDTWYNFHPQPTARISSAKHKLTLFTRQQINLLSKMVHSNYPQPSSHNSQDIWQQLLIAETGDFDFWKLHGNLCNFLDANCGQRSEVVLLNSIEQLFHAAPLNVDPNHVTRDPGFWARYQQNATRNSTCNNHKEFVFEAATVITYAPLVCYALNPALSVGVALGIFFVYPVIIPASLYALHCAGKGLFDTLTKKQHDCSRIKNALGMLSIFNEKEIAELATICSRRFNAMGLSSIASRKLKLELCFDRFSNKSSKDILDLISDYLSKTDNDANGTPVAFSHAGRAAYDVLLCEIEQLYSGLDTNRKLLASSTYHVVLQNNDRLQLVFSDSYDCSQITRYLMAKNLSSTFGRKNCLDVEFIEVKTHNTNQTLWVLNLTRAEYEHAWGQNSYQHLLDKLEESNSPSYTA